MRWFILLAFSFRLFADVFDDVTSSTSEEILSLTTDLLVDGFVSVSSGQFSVSEVDLTVRGAQDLVLKRIYVPPRILGRYDDKDTVDRLSLGKELCQLETKGWVIHPHLWAGYNQNSKYFQVRDPQGFVLEFQIQGNKGILKTDTYGCSNLSEEQHYGSDRNLKFTIYRTYNEKGELLNETNPIGEIASYNYDLRGRCFYEKPFSNGLTIRRTFDDKGRLILLQEGDHEMKFDYNSSDELIQKIDYLDDYDIPL